LTGKTHNTNGPCRGARSSDGRLDIKLSEPASGRRAALRRRRSACYMAQSSSPPCSGSQAYGRSGGRRRIDLNQADGAFFLRARLNVSVPGVEREQAQA